MTSSHPPARAGSEISVLLLLEEAAEPWVATFASLRSVAPELEVYVAAANPSTLRELAELGWSTAGEFLTANPSEAISELARRTETHLLVVHSPVVFPEDFLGPAEAIAAGDLRCSSVSFWSNAAGMLSFPSRHEPRSHSIGGHDEQSITRALRARATLQPTPIPYAIGPLTLLTRQGLSMIGRFPDRPRAEFALAVAEYSCRTRVRGLVDLLEPSTFITRPRDVVGELAGGSWLTDSQSDWLTTHFPAIAAAPFEDGERHAAFERTFQLARAAVFGLRVLIDGTMLGPTETGTQVTVIALIRELIARDDVSYLGVALHGAVPEYARELLSDQKVDIAIVKSGDLSVFPPVDIVHRPFQTEVGVRPSEWRQVGARTVMTVLDLIAYQIPGYRESPVDWFRYRSLLRASCGEVDAVLVISEEVRRQVLLEQIPVEEARLYTVACGMDHLRGDERAVMPAELLARGFSGERFALVLGTNYTHKNRDLAIRAVDELRSRGHELTLVLAGAHVPFGSSRTAEAQATTPESAVFLIPDVTTAERNWLLRHAEVVIYPSGVEGFGLVPNEAAAFGTPTVFVNMPPFTERFASLPVSASDWTVGAIADATERLLISPDLVKAQVAAINAESSRYDWRTSVNEVVRIYWSLLARPPHRDDEQPDAIWGWE